MRLVLDTDVLVAGLRSPSGASRWLLTAVLQRRVEAVVSVPLMLEYEAVVTRPEHLAAANLTRQAAGSVLDALAAVSWHVTLSFRWRPLLADANDDMVLETAISGGAMLLVTFNVRDFRQRGEAFGCQSVLPRQAVEIVRRNAG